MNIVTKQWEEKTWLDKSSSKQYPIYLVAYNIWFSGNTKILETRIFN